MSRKIYRLTDFHGRQRRLRPTMKPAIHFAPISSGNRLVKETVPCDRVVCEIGAMCFEMEAAGVVSTVPSLVIHGICDYCDVYKNEI